jgi:hypothetical protein
VKVIASGSSGTPMALLCLRYTGGASGDYDCVALEPGVGAQLRAKVGGTVTSGATLAATVALGTWYDVQLSVDATGALSASVDGAALGGLAAGVLASGFVAVATQSAEAAFDDVVVTQP